MILEKFGRAEEDIWYAFEREEQPVSKRIVETLGLEGASSLLPCIDKFLITKDIAAHPPVIPGIQRSTDSSSNSRAATLPYRPEKPAREACAACRRGFVGGWLLGCRESAKSVLQKSELASCSRSDSGLL